ncbi:Dimethylaniline monooxygenase [Pleurostoma richardsiae]|uniref:Dimethylaniline monooxygenase n=1 Tax=Pleurostoma richardsiae TaxID=41990 RepID=A0AA38RD78_9PEZI|nr:Dimethylaniline monooxygenase [Pleurostoma richardsiae]
MPKSTFRVAIIGGGPSGLATLKFLQQAHKFNEIRIEARLFEEGDQVGGTFRDRVYEDAELVSSKYLTAFSDFRFAKDVPDFVTPDQYCAYLEGYATEFGLWDNIECSTQVTGVRKRGKRHIISFLKVRLAEDARHMSKGGPQFGPKEFTQKSWVCDAVAVCSGLHVQPNMPVTSVPGLAAATRSPSATVEDAKIQIMHSSQFKARSQLGNDKTVLILGAGETAMDIAHLAVTSPTKEVMLAHRDGFYVAPKIIPEPVVFNGFGKAGPGPIPNKPTDCAVASLFDTAYLPPIIQRSSLLWWSYNTFVQGMAYILSGTTAGYGQWGGELPKHRRHVDSFYFVKSMRAIPYFSEQYRSTALWNRIRAWIVNMKLEPTDGRKIELAPWPSRVDEHGLMYFEQNGRPEARRMAARGGIKVDIVVFATGYDQSFPFLDTIDRYPTLDDACVRGIYRDITDRFAYIGFVRPSFGAIPPLAELQAQRWVSDLLIHLGGHPRYDTSALAIRPYELDYELRNRGAPHHAQRRLAVDHEAYAYQLALDMGAAPTWRHVLQVHGWKVFYTWAMGSNFNTKFRLIGPWSSPVVAEEAAAVMRGELWDVVSRTGGGVFFFTYTLIPLLIFGPLSIMINICSVFGLI